MLLSSDDIKSLIPQRKSISHKGTYGKVLIIAGSLRFPGASILCANSAQRTGSGLVTLAVEDEIFDITAVRLKEVMPLNIDKFYRDFENLVKTADAIAIGPGMQKRAYTLEKLGYVIENSSCPIVIDADGLNVISENISILNNLKNEVVLTPHEGEFARLTNFSINEIQTHKINIAKNFVKKYPMVNLVLKGPETIIASKDKTNIVDIGVPEMATGGMGDTLTGIITSLIGQKLCVYDACCLGTFVHSYIANKLARNMYSVLAQDVIENIPSTLRNLQKGLVKLL